MNQENKQKISLLGFMGSGKTTTGRRLAQLMGLDFYDLDEMIESGEGHSVGEIFDLHGEDEFRRLETLYLNDFLINHNRFVLSLGGGTPCYNDNMSLVNKHCLSFYLRGSIDWLADRLACGKAHRPLLANLDDVAMRAFIEKKLWERGEFYNLARYTVIIDGKTQSEVAAEINYLAHQ